MLRKETVHTPLLETLAVLMGMKTIKAHRLVGGTALALQIGHRISVDIALFSDKQNNYDDILQELSEKFGKNFEKARNINSPQGKGIAVFLNDVKTDILDWNTKFIRPPFIDENIRMANKEDIIPMKFNTFLCSPEYARYEKKDYLDIANLMKEFTLARMIDLYKERYPNESMSDRLMIEGLQLNEMADIREVVEFSNEKETYFSLMPSAGGFHPDGHRDRNPEFVWYKKIMPKMLTGESWDDAKKQIEKSIAIFIESKINKG